MLLSIIGLIRIRRVHRNFPRGGENSKLKVLACAKRARFFSPPSEKFSPTFRGGRDFPRGGRKSWRKLQNRRPQGAKKKFRKILLEYLLARTSPPPLSKFSGGRRPPLGCPGGAKLQGWRRPPLKSPGVRRHTRPPQCTPLIRTAQFYLNLLKRLLKTIFRQLSTVIQPFKIKRVRLQPFKMKQLWLRPFKIKWLWLSAFKINWLRLRPFKIKGLWLQVNFNKIICFGMRKFLVLTFYQSWRKMKASLALPLVRPLANWWLRWFDNQYNRWNEDLISEFSSLKKATK